AALRRSKRGDCYSCDQCRLYAWPDRADPLGSLVLGDAADVQNGEAELEDDQGPGFGVTAPGDPKDVAEDEYPEAPLPPGFRLFCDEPGREKGCGHRGPLQVLHP